MSPVRRSAAVVGAATLVAGLLGFAWLGSLQDERTSGHAPSKHHPESIVLKRLLRAQPIGLPVDERASSAPASSPTDVTSKAAWDLCGVGLVPVPVTLTANANANGLTLADLPSPLGEHAMTVAADRLIVRLTSGLPRQQAVAALLKMHDVQNRDDVEAIASRLADLAAVSNDPVVLGWALSMCSSYRSGLCDEGLARRWVAIESDNAAAWLALAHVQGVSRDEVNRGLLRTTRYGTSYGAAAAAMQAAWPADLPQYLKVAATASGLGFDALVSSLHVQLAFSHCSATHQVGISAMNACAALAESMTEHSDSLIGALTGTALGRRLGWRNERVDAARSKIHALQTQAAASFDFSSAQALSCREVDRFDAYVQDVVALGEVATLRRQRSEQPR